MYTINRGLILAFVAFAMFVLIGFLQENESPDLIHCVKIAPENPVADSKSILFLGNSLLHDYDWSIDRFQVINCARQGLTLEKYLTMKQEIENDHVEFIVIAFGTVEAIRQKTITTYEQESFLHSLNELHEILSTDWKQARVIVTAVPPINNLIYEGENVDAALVQMINQDIARVFKESSEHWVELTAILDTNASGLTDEMTYDGVHLSDIAYLRWNAELEKVTSARQ